jgi:hypothetical protein
VLIFNFETLRRNIFAKIVEIKHHRQHAQSQNDINNYRLKPNFILNAFCHDAKIRKKSETAIEVKNSSVEQKIKFPTKKETSPAGAASSNKNE